MAKNDTVIIYEKPTCSTCNAAMALLRDMGVQFEKVDYYEAPLTEEKLAELVRKMDITPRELLRTHEPIYKELGLADRLKDGSVTDSELIALMVAHPDLMQRPIVEKGDRAVLGRPVENLKQLI